MVLLAGASEQHISTRLLQGPGMPLAVTPSWEVYYRHCSVRLLRTGSTCVPLQVITVNFGLRFSWTVSLVPVDSMPLWLAQYMDYWMIATLEVAELFRRTMWGWMR